jgi:hypothetical protein
MKDHINDIVLRMYSTSCNSDTGGPGQQGAVTDPIMIPSWIVLQRSSSRREGRTTREVSSPPLLDLCPHLWFLCARWMR